MSMPLQPHQERVIEEEGVLAEKLDRLNEFINGKAFGKLPPEERRLMRQQAKHMLGYRDVLRFRINGFAPPATDEPELPF